MLAAPPITLADLRQQLETEELVRLSATETDYFALLDETVAVADFRLPMTDLYQHVVFPD